MASYQTAIRSIANEMLAGEDAESRITALADSMHLDRSSVTHDINEMIDLLK